MAKDFYKIKIDAKQKLPELKTKTIKIEELNGEQKIFIEETKKENKNNTAWLMPSGNIFWTSKGMEINNAKKILFKEEKQAKEKNKAKTKKKK